ncbi:hypothetical protein GZ098_11455 [Staphylococcus aureus]|nr:hypothetical protein [Staphylococcus aureus]NDP91195.1 hypothetical protein [Staphylococcus aureus]
MRLCENIDASSNWLNQLGFFFQAEGGIRDRSVSRGLVDVYKQQAS